MTNLTKAIAALGVVAGLGVAALPLTSYAVTEYKGVAANEGDPLKATHDVNLSLTIKETLSMFVTTEDGSADVSDPVQLTGSNNVDFESAPIAIKVNAGNKSGYYLTISGNTTGDDKTVLKNGNGATIKAGNLLSTADSQWGYKVTKGAADSPEDTTWNAVAAGGAATTIDSLGAAGVQTTKVKFGAHIIDGQESGDYTGTVTFTATAGAATANPEG